MSYNGEYYAEKLELVKYFYEKIEEAPDFDMKNHLTKKGIFHYYVYNGLFQNNKVYNYLIEKSTVYSRAKYPLIFKHDHLIIIGGVELYITPELYAKNKSIFKNINEIAPINVTSDLLNRFRTQLNDPVFSVSKIYGFRNVFQYTNYVLNVNDLIMPDFNVFIKIKNSQKVNDIFKNTFELQYNLLDNKTYSSEKTSTPSLDQRIKTIKEIAPEKIESEAIWLSKKAFRKSKFEITNARI